MRALQLVVKSYLGTIWSICLTVLKPFRTFLFDSRHIKEFSRTVSLTIFNCKALTIDINGGWEITNHLQDQHWYGAQSLTDNDASRFLHYKSKYLSHHRKHLTFLSCSIRDWHFKHLKDYPVEASQVVAYIWCVLSYCGNNIYGNGRKKQREKIRKKASQK